MEMKASTITDQPATAILELDGELDASNYLDVIDEVRQLYRDGTRTW
jgi:hypothetical protein